MTDVPRKDHAASVRQRLYNHAKAHGENVERVMTRYAIERFLFRLMQTEAKDRYILKGAMLFVTWPEHAFRPTGDVDLLGRGDSSSEAITQLFATACAVECKADGIQFDSSTLQIQDIREDDQYGGVRVKLKGVLSKAVLSMQVDVGFGDHVHPAPSRRNFPGLIDGLPLPDILMYPPETVVAEKFEAMIRLGEANGRIKDFHDVWVATKTFEFDSETLVEAIRGTLVRRDTAIPVELPLTLQSGFGERRETGELWKGFLRRTTPALAAPEFSELLYDLRLFFGPLLAPLNGDATAGGIWSITQQRWNER